MLRWTEPALGDKIADIVASINLHGNKLYDMDLTLAQFSDTPAGLHTLDALHNAIEEALKATQELAGHAGEYLRGMLRGMRMIVRVMQGDDIPYQQQIADMQQVQSAMVPQERYDRLAEDIARQLRDRGYQGPLAQQVNAWLEDTRIAPDQVVGETRRLLAACKAATQQRVVKLPPQDEIADIQGATGVMWSGNSAYLGQCKGQLSFNLDRPWSTPTFANILCHEGYPGHQTFYCHWDSLFQQGKLPLEAAYYVKSTPTNLVFEGAPESALHFLGWDDTEEDTPGVPDALKKDYALGRAVLDLQRIPQQNCCHMANVEGCGKDEALAYLAGFGFFSPVEAVNTWRFVTHVTRRTYYPSYYYGRWLVQRAYQMMDKSQRNDFFANLYNCPHTTETFIRSMETLSGKSFHPFEGL